MTQLEECKELLKVQLERVEENTKAIQDITAQLKQLLEQIQDDGLKID